MLVGAEPEKNRLGRDFSRLGGTYGGREGVHTVGNVDKDWEASGGDDEEREERWRK